MKSRIVETKYERIVISYPDDTTITQYRHVLNNLKNRETTRAIVLPITWNVEWFPRFRLKDLINYIVQVIRGWLYR